MGAGPSSRDKQTNTPRPPLPEIDSSFTPEFDALERQAIHGTWAKLECSFDALARDIFLRIFELRPEVKRFFPFRTTEGEALVKHPYFKSHSIRFINAVRMTIDNMDAWEVIHIPNLRKLGEHHTRIPGFTHDIFDVFYYAMDDVWTVYLGRTYSGLTKEAWCKLFKFIVNQVEVGYTDHLDKNRNKTALLQKQQHPADQRTAGDNVESSAA